MPRTLKFEHRLERYPPILVRILTRYGHGKNSWWPSDQEIAEQSGLPIAEVLRVSYSIQWIAIPFGVMQGFFRGCRIDLEDYATFRRLEYMRRRGHFRDINVRDNAQLSAMFDIWVESTE